MGKLDRQEAGLLKSFEKDEWKSATRLERKRKRYQEYAKATFKKDRRVNIRISAKDLEAIQKRAIEEGIPYQTLIASLLHKYVSGRNKVAIVTGAGTGIGKAVAIALLEDGYRVTLAGRRKDRLQEAAAEAGPAATRALVVSADVSDPESVRSLFARTKEAFGRLDLLFNNAGVNVPGLPLEDLSYEQWKSVVDVNLTGAFLCTQEAFKLMKVQDPRGGRIINNGSISAYVPRPNSAPYTATKHAITGLTKSTSLDGRKYDIACGQIDIGNAATEMTSRMAMGVQQADGSMAPEPRIDVTHVARAVLYMANLPLDANVQFMTIMATKMPFIGRG